MAEGGGEEPDKSQKTEDPTPKKIEDSRKKGQVANSKELNTWMLLLSALLLITFAGEPVASHLQKTLTVYLEMAHALPQAPGGLLVTLGHMIGDVALALLFPLLVFALAAFLGPYMQVGSIFAPDVIKPDFKKVSLIKGVERIFSIKSLIEFVKGVLKIILITVVAYMMIEPYLAGIDHLVGLSIPLLLAEIVTLIVRMLTGIVIAFFGVAIIDILYQRFEHHQQLRMTKQEVKDEFKQTEGDPHVKGKLKQIRAERARTRMMANVPTADVVITNPTHFAVALSYDPAKSPAPMVVAKGQDLIALKIREIAKEHGVPIMENPPLARTLFDTVDLDEMIPPTLYQAVAEIISFVFRQKGKIR